MATGTRPTKTPSSAWEARFPASRVGVDTATAISCSNVAPVLVTMLMACASPSTHGKGKWIHAVAPRPSGPAGSCVNCQYASSTWTWAIVIGSEPPARTRTRMPSDERVVRSKVRLSTGGAPFPKFLSGSETSSQVIARPRAASGRISHSKAARDFPEPTGAVGSAAAMCETSFMRPPPPRRTCPSSRVR